MPWKQLPDCRPSKDVGTTFFAMECDFNQACRLVKAASPQKFFILPLYHPPKSGYLCVVSPQGLQGLLFPARHSFGGALVSTGMLEALVAGRGAAGLVKSGIKVIANNDYDYALAA